MVREIPAPGAGEHFVLEKDQSSMFHFYPGDDEKAESLGRFIREWRKKEVEDFLFNDPFALILKLENFWFRFCIDKYISSGDPDWSRTSISVYDDNQIYYELLRDETLMVSEFDYLIRQLQAFVWHKELDSNHFDFLEPYITVRFVMNDQNSDLCHPEMQGMYLSLRYEGHGTTENSLCIHLDEDECESLLAYCGLMRKISM